MSLEDFTSGWRPRESGEKRCAPVEIKSGDLIVSPDYLSYGCNVEITEGKDRLPDRSPDHKVLIEIIDGSGRDFKARIEDPDGCKQRLDDQEEQPDVRRNTFDPLRGDRKDLMSSVMRP